MGRRGNPNLKGKFESILALKLKLMESFPDNVPPATDFQVGYLEGKQSSKRWLVCPEDLESMYLARERNICLVRCSPKVSTGATYIKNTT